MRKFIPIDRGRLACDIDMVRRRERRRGVLARVRIGVVRFVRSFWS
jgi:hypothetical protein